MLIFILFVDVECEIDAVMFYFICRCDFIYILYLFVCIASILFVCVAARILLLLFVCIARILVYSCLHGEDFIARILPEISRFRLKPERWFCTGRDLRRTTTGTSTGWTAWNFYSCMCVCSEYLSYVNWTGTTPVVSKTHSSIMITNK
jgi:hypothetical protein